MNYAVHLITDKGRVIQDFGSDRAGATAHYIMTRTIAERTADIVEHADGNGFFAKNRENGRMTYDVRLIGDYDEAFEHVLSFYDYDGMALEHDIEANRHGNMSRSDAIRTAVDAGCFLFYDDDIADFLVEYDGYESNNADANFERYKQILCDALAF